MSSLISEGRSAPAFCLPGVVDDGVRLVRLEDRVANGPALLVFVPDSAERSDHGPRQVAETLSWFALIEGVSPLVVSNRRYGEHRGGDGESADAAPILGDGEERVGSNYGVQYAEGRVVVYLVDETRTVRARWRTGGLDELDLTAVNEAAKDVAKPSDTVNS